MDDLNVELKAESNFNVLGLASCYELGTLSREGRRDTRELLKG